MSPVQVVGGGSRTARTVALAAVIALCSAMFGAITAVPSRVSAAPVTIGAIQAQMANHQGQNNGTAGNCITYAPPGTATSSALVTTPNEAQTGHGRPTSSGACPSPLSTTTQSVIGFRPSATTSAEDGALFLIGRMVHYNNPVFASDRYFTGAMNVVLGGFTAPNTLSFPWQLDETPNSPVDVNDEISFTSQISTTTLTQGGLSFRLVILGFVPIATGTPCPALPPPGQPPLNRFSTVERQQTNACLYASLQQLRSLTVVKQVAGTPPGPSTFNFTSTSSLAGSAWDNGTFPLGAGGSVTRSLVSGNSVTVTETDPGDDRWALTGLTCTQIGADGLPQPVPGATLNLAARQVVLANVPPPPNVAQPGITCTYTNTYTPKATLTLVKSVQSGTAPPSLWTLTATGSVAPPPSGTIISGPSGSPAVTTQRVPAGTYSLTETGTGAAATGYVQVGDWACRTTAGAVVPVAGGNVTVADSAATTSSANVTCTVTNRLATGSLQIAKIVDAPAGAYTGGTTKTFAGTYDCGTGASGSFSTLTTAVPVTIALIPAGRSCTVTETAPTGGLLNASYAWGPPTFSTQPVTIVDQGTAQVTITNPVVQRFGTFSITKTISGPGGYTGGTTRVFPVAYSCTLVNGPTTTGTLDLTTGQAVSPATSIPTGSVCAFTETLQPEPGDFADPSYVWTGSSVSPTTVTIGDGTTATLTITNTYARELGSLVIAKVVVGGGYLGGADPNFTVVYNCGSDFTGSVTIGDGASATVTGLPARLSCSVQEIPPAPDILGPAFVWGTPTWSPGPIATIPANGSTTLTVSNPTEPIFGQVSVTKVVTGETQGVTADATFSVVAACTNGVTYPFVIGVNDTATTPDLPVGTTCTITEDPPSGGLVDDSYAWGPTPGPQVVTVTSSGQVAAVTVANTVVRVTGQLAIAKAPIAPAGIVDAGRTYAVGFRCVYGGDPPVEGIVTLTAGGPPATTPPVLIGSLCTVTEDPASLTAPPSATDPSWVWLPVTYAPEQPFVVTSPTTVSVTVSNTIVQLTGAFNVSKIVTGEGKEGGYTPGAAFAFTYDCGLISGTFDFADGDSFQLGPLPAFTTCTVTETGRPAPNSPAYGWDPVQFTVNGVASGSGDSVTFQILEAGAVQVNVTNPITPRLGTVIVEKAITGETAGLAPGAPPFSVTLTCSGGRSFQLSVPADGDATQDGIPVGAVCTATESLPTGGLVDASYAWAAPTFVPADATVTVDLDDPAVVTVVNEIVRVTAPVQLVKSYSGPQGIIDPAREYPVSWECTYNGGVVASGDELIIADPTGITVADDVPLTSVCTATEGDLGPPSDDPAFRWLDPVITGTTVTVPGPNAITVANTLTRDSGTVFVRKEVIGETQGYIRTIPASEDFTLHGQCLVPGHPEIPTRYADGSIADGGEVPITASIGWTCSGYEDTPSQSLLLDDSYAWGPAILDPAGTFVLTREAPTRVFLAQNPIVRVRSSFSIVKQIVDPNGVVDDIATFTGTYSCQYGSDAPVGGSWTITPATATTVTVADDILLGSVCSVTEEAPGTTGLPDASWTWSTPVIGAPATVVAGGTASVTVTNTAERLWAGLQVTKAVVDPDGGVLPGAEFGGVWSCTQGADTYSDRFTVGVGVDATAVLFLPADALVPATAICTITEDTLDRDDLRDGSFDWGEPTYAPEDVTLVAGQTATLGVTNTVIRVYSDVAIRKVVTGPADGLVPDDRPFSGSVTCRYGTDAPIETTWSATIAVPALRAGVLVGSVCAAIEESPGFGGQPVADDSSYIWLDPIVSDPVTVTAPDTTTPPIVVTNPTDRLFGRFSVAKTVTGAVEGIVDPGQPYLMSYDCIDGLGNSFTGQLTIAIGGTRAVGPEEQIPTGSECTLDEPLEGMPALQDEAWTWQDPAFTVDGQPAVGEGRVLRFTIPTPQEDEPEPNVAVGVTNTVVRAFGSFSVAKSSDPASGTIVQPGSIVTYSLRVTSTGAVPVHDVVLTDDLSGVLASATVVAGSITAPAGTSAIVDAAAQRLVWTVGTMATDTTQTLTYQVRVNPGAGGVTIRNQVTGVGDVPPATCAPGSAADPPCAVSNATSRTAYVTKEIVGDPVRNATTGEWAVAYRVVVINPDSTGAAPYTVSDTLGFAPGFEVRSAGVTSAPAGVALASPAWDGTANILIATGASLPAGATHTYELSVRVFVPPAAPVSVLDCSTNPEAAGSGFFNSARVTSLGAESTDSACAPVRLMLEVAKRWVIDGREYADGTQPALYSAQLTLDRGDGAWSTRYLGYLPGVSVEVGERVQVPAGCSNRSSGAGAVVLRSAVTSLSVTNVVTCGGSLPWTGFAGHAPVVWGALSVAAGAVLVFGTRRRRFRGSPS